MTLGEKIRELREKKDMSLREFGRRLNNQAPTSAAFLSDVELGRRFPTDKLLAIIADVLGTTFEELKQLDARVPVNELKKLAHQEPAFGLALRRVVDEQISAEELNSLLNKVKSKGK